MYHHFEVKNIDFQIFQKFEKFEALLMRTERTSLEVLHKRIIAVNRAASCPEQISCGMELHASLMRFVGLSVRLFSCPLIILCLPVVRCVRSFVRS